MTMPSQVNTFYPERVDSLTLVQPTPEYASRTCGPYWYLVQRHHGPWTAFNRRESLLNWLQERGLKLEHDLVPQGEHDFQRIVGAYESAMHWSYDVFFGLPGVIAETRVMSNGDYTLGRITESADGGLRQIHYLNPNCRHRPTFDPNESRAKYG